MNTSGSEELGFATEKICEGSISWCNMVEQKVMHKGSIAEDLEGFSKTKASCVEPHNLAMPFLLFQPHLRMYITYGGQGEVTGAEEMRERGLRQ